MSVALPPSLSVTVPSVDLDDPDARTPGGLTLLRLHGVPIGAAVLEEGPAAAALREPAFALAVLDHQSGDLGGGCAWSVPAERRAWSVVIATRDRPTDLRRCVESIVSARADIEIVVVDNASHDPDAVTAAVADIHQVVLLREPVPGASRARNRGIAAASGEFVALTDDDVVVDHAWLEAFERRLDREPDLAALTGQVVPASMETEAERCFEQYGGFNKGPLPRTFDLRANRPSSPLFPWAAGQIGSGNNVVFRREVLVELCGFDPVLGPGTPTRAGEDLDLFVRTILQGHTMAYEPTALVWHHHRRDLDQLRRQLRDYGVGLSAMLCHRVATSPGNLLAVARRAPSGTRHLIGGGSTRNSARTDEFPADLARAELKGFTGGPGALARARRDQRRLPPSRLRGDVTTEEGRVGPVALEAGTRRHMSRSTTALMINMLGTGVLGLVFWAVAARTYPAEEVGRVSALVSAMTLASGIGQLNLQQGIPRFLPGLRHGAMGFLLRCYGAALAVTAIAAVVVAAVIVAKDGSTLIGSPAEAGWFVAAALIWTMFTLQDAALVALREARWVPVENVAFAVTKIVLAVVLLTVTVRNGLFLAWMVPVALAIVPVSWFIVRRLLPRHAQSPAGRVTPVPNRRRFLLADYAGQLAGLAAMTAMPLIVALVISPEQAAYFAAAWIAVVIADQLLSAVVTPLVVEGSHDPAQLPGLTRHSLKILAMTVLPLALVGAVVAPTVLAVLGPQYAAAAGSLLRLVCLGVLARAIVLLRLAQLRVQSDLRRILFIGWFSALGLLLGSWIGLHRWGLVGVGWAYLVTQVALAAWAVPSLLRAGSAPRQMEVAR